MPNQQEKLVLYTQRYPLPDAKPVVRISSSAYATLMGLKGRTGMSPAALVDAVLAFALPYIEVQPHSKNGQP